MSDIDYNLLGGDVGGEPPDGWKGVAILVRAARAGSPTALVTEFQSLGDPPYYWTTWFGFQANRISITQEFLDAIGVDRSKLMVGDSQEERDESMDNELYAVTGQEFYVECSTWARGVNTRVVGPADEPEPAQASLDDVPIATEDLPAVSVPAAAAASTDADDDIPF